MYTILPYLSGKGKLKIYDNYNSFLTGGIEMIFITGDMHGLMERFQDSAFRHIKKGDTLIICGDFGFLWEGTVEEKRR